MTEAQQAQVKDWVTVSPWNLKPVLEQIKSTWDITISRDTLKRLLKSVKMRWPPMRRVTPHRPLSAEYQRKRSALDSLKTLDASGKIKLYYTDESGFTLMPLISYAWQSVGETLGGPSRRSPRLTVFACLHRQGPLDSDVFEQSITSDVVVTYEEYIANRFNPILKKGLETG